MKKIIITIIILIFIITLITAGYFLLTQNSKQQKEIPLEKEVVLPPSEKILFDTNDNLDQAIDDLNQIE